MDLTLKGCGEDHRCSYLGLRCLPSIREDYPVFYAWLTPGLLSSVTLFSLVNVVMRLGLTAVYVLAPSIVV